MHRTRDGLWTLFVLHSLDCFSCTAISITALHLASLTVRIMNRCCLQLNSLQSNSADDASLLQDDLAKLSCSSAAECYWRSALISFACCCRLKASRSALIWLKHWFIEPIISIWCQRTRCFAHFSTCAPDMNAK